VREPSPGKGTSASALWSIVLIPIALFLARDVVPPVRFFIWHGASLAWFAVLLFSAWWQGSVVLAALEGTDDADPPLPRFITALGLGLGLYALEVYLLGALGLFDGRVFTLLVLVLFGAGAFRVRSLLPGLRSDRLLVVEQVYGSRLPLSLASLAVVISFPFALVPTRAFDTLAYHLEVPARYLQAGRIIDIPENIYSYAPQLNHALYGLAIGLRGSDLAGLINHFYFVLALTVLWLGFRDRFRPGAGAWAAALVSMSPLMLLEAANGGVDWAAAFYTVAALSVLMGGTGDLRRVILAGVLAGMAAGCRHQPLGYAIVIPAMAGFLDDLFSRRGLRTGAWSLYLGVAVLAAFPWYLRNWIFTGDPLFPLLANLAGRTEAGSHLVSSLVGAKPLALWWKWAVLPFRMVFDPLSYSMTATVGVQYLVLLPLLAMRGRRPARNRFLLWWLILAFLAWYLNFRTARYAMPLFLVSALWLGDRMAGAGEEGARFSPVLKGIVSIVLVVNAGVFIGLQDYVNRSVGAALGTISSSRYLVETYEIYPAIDFLNRLDPSPGRVLFVGEMRGFYSHFPREVPSHNAPNRLLEAIKEGLPEKAVAGELNTAGFTHLLVNTSEWWRMAYRNRNAPAWQLSEAQQARFRVFLDDGTEKIFSDGPVTVYRLTASESHEGDMR